MRVAVPPATEMLLTPSMLAPSALEDIAGEGHRLASPCKLLLREGGQFAEGGRYRPRDMASLLMKQEAGPEQQHRDGRHFW